MNFVEQLAAQAPASMAPVRERRVPFAAAVIEYVLLVVLSVALTCVMARAVGAADQLQGNVALAGTVSAVLLALLCAAWRRFKPVLMCCAAAVLAVAFCAAFTLLTNQDAPLSLDAGLQAAYAAACVLVPAALFGITRKQVGTALLMALTLALCCIAQGLNPTWLTVGGGLAWTACALVCSCVLLVFHQYQDGFSAVEKHRVEAAKKQPGTGTEEAPAVGPFAAFGMSLAAVGACMGIGALVFLLASGVLGANLLEPEEDDTAANLVADLSSSLEDSLSDGGSWSSTTYPDSSNLSADGTTDTYGSGSTDYSGQDAYGSSQGYDSTSSDGTGYGETLTDGSQQGTDGVDDLYYDNTSADGSQQGADATADTSTNDQTYNTASSTDASLTDEAYADETTDATNTSTATTAPDSSVVNEGNDSTTTATNTSDTGTAATTTDTTNTTAATDATDDTTVGADELPVVTDGSTQNTAADGTTADGATDGTATGTVDGTGATDTGSTDATQSDPFGLSGTDANTGLAADQQATDTQAAQDQDAQGGAWFVAAVVAVVLVILLAIAAAVAVAIATRRHRAARERLADDLMELPCANRVVKMYDVVADKLAVLGFEKPAGMTQLEWAMASRADLAPLAKGTGGVDLLTLTLVYQRVAFGTGNVTESDYQRMEVYYRKFFKNAKAYVGYPRWFVLFWRL